MFKGQGAGTAVSGRLCGGVVQVGERLRVLPGDETAVVKCKVFHLWAGVMLIASQVIEVEDENVPWAAVGSNVTLFLTAIDPVHLNIGSILCPPTDLVPLAISFTARIIVFDIQVPITAGASVSLSVWLKLHWPDVFLIGRTLPSLTRRFCYDFKAIVYD